MRCSFRFPVAAHGLASGTGVDVAVCIGHARTRLLLGLLIGLRRADLLELPQSLLQPLLTLRYRSLPRRVHSLAQLLRARISHLLDLLARQLQVSPQALLAPELDLP